MMLLWAIGLLITGCSYFNINSLYSCTTPTGDNSYTNCKYRSADNCFELSNKFSIINGTKRRVWYVRPTSNSGCSYHSVVDGYIDKPNPQCTLQSGFDERKNDSSTGTVSCNEQRNRALYSDNSHLYYATIETSADPLELMPWRVFSSQGGGSGGTFENSMKLEYYYSTLLSSYPQQYSYFKDQIIGTSSNLEVNYTNSLLPASIVSASLQTINFLQIFASLGNCLSFSASNINEMNEYYSNTTNSKAHHYFVNLISLYCSLRLVENNFRVPFSESKNYHFVAREHRLKAIELEEAIQSHDFLGKDIEKIDLLMFRSILNMSFNKQSSALVTQYTNPFPFPITHSDCNSYFIHNSAATQSNFRLNINSIDSCNSIANGILSSFQSTIIDVSPIDAISAILQSLKEYSLVDSLNSNNKDSCDNSYSLNDTFVLDYDYMIKSYCSTLILEKGLYFDSVNVDPSHPINRQFNSVIDNCEYLSSNSDGVRFKFDAISRKSQRNKLFAFGLLIFNHIVAFGQINIATILDNVSSKISPESVIRMYTESIESVYDLLAPSSTLNIRRQEVKSFNPYGDYAEFSSILNHLSIMNFKQERLEFFGEVLEVVKKNFLSKLKEFNGEIFSPGHSSGFLIKLSDDIVLFLANKFSGVGKFDISLTLLEALLKKNSNELPVEIHSARDDCTSQVSHDLGTNFNMFYTCFDNFLDSFIDDLRNYNAKSFTFIDSVANNNSCKCLIAGLYNTASVGSGSLPLSVSALNLLLSRKYLFKILTNSNLLKFYISLAYSINAPLVISSDSDISSSNETSNLLSLGFCKSNFISRWSTFGSINIIAKICSNSDSINLPNYEEFCYMSDPLSDFNSKGLFLLAYQGYSVCDALYSIKSNESISKIDSNLRFFQFFGNDNLQFDYVLPRQFNRLMQTFASFPFNFNRSESNNSDEIRDSTPLNSNINCNNTKTKRIGFISSYFSNHSVGKLLGNLIKMLLTLQSNGQNSFCNHHHEYFIIEIMSYLPGSSSFSDTSSSSTSNLLGSKNPVKKNLLKLVDLDHWIQTPKRFINNEKVKHLSSFELVLADIRELELDIAVFGDIYMDALTTYVSQFRVAPFELAFWGHPFTSIPSASNNGTIDYFITSVGFEPDSLRSFRSNHFHEQLVVFESLNFLMFEDYDNKNNTENIDKISHNLSHAEVDFSNNSPFLTTFVELAAKERYEFLNKLFRSAYMINDVLIKDFFGYSNFNSWYNQVNRNNSNIVNNSPIPTVKIVSILQTTMKMHPLLDLVISELLQSDPNILIIISRSAKYFLWQHIFQERLTNTCKDLGIIRACMNRVLFIDQGPHEVYTSFLCNSDVSLDPIVFGGGVTLVDGLSQCYNEFLIDNSSDLLSPDSLYNIKKLLNRVSNGGKYQNFIDWYNMFYITSLLCQPEKNFNVSDHHADLNFNCNNNILDELSKFSPRIVPFSTRGELQSVHKLGKGISNHLYNATGLDIFKISKSSESQSNYRSYPKLMANTTISSFVMRNVQSMVHDTIRIAKQSYYHKIIMKFLENSTKTLQRSEFVVLNLNQVIKRDLFGRAGPQSPPNVVLEWIRFFNQLTH